MIKGKEAISMEKTNKRLKQISWILFIIQTIGTGILMKILPDRMPMHFDSQGRPDRYGSKYELIIIVVLSLLVLLLYEGFVKDKTEKQEASEDERQKAYGLITKYSYRICEIVIILIMILVEISLTITAFKKAEDFAVTDSIEWLMTGVNILLALVLIVFGNIMPKTRNNGIFGMRTVWSRYNDETWYRTNRIVGKLGVAVGVISLLVSVFVQSRIALFIILGLISVWAVVSVVISKKIYDDECKKTIKNE